MILPFRKSRPAFKVILALALTTGWLHAAPYGPEGMPIEWTQPDGSQLSLRVFGDEFYGRTETLDGYTVVFDPATKSYYYAEASVDGQELVATGMALGKENPQTLGLAKHLDIQPAARKAKALARVQQWDEATQTSQRWTELKAQRQAYDAALQAAKAGDGPMPAPPSFTTVGNKVGLTLLIDFSDAPGTITQANVIDYCNGDNYTGYSNNGSVKKYYQDNSNNLLTYTNTVTAYIRMAQPKSYYNDTTVDCGLRGRLLISDAIDIMKALPNYATEILPTFDTLTVDGSNRVAACNVFFAGGDSGVWSFGLWPHSWSLAAAKELSAGGKKVYNYQITNLGTSLSLGTFCHENGHMLCGYPDIYDYNYDSKGGAGGFCLMGYGASNTNPVLINAYLKRASGWTTTTELATITNSTATLVSTVGNTDYNKIYRYANPSAPTTEYFLLENRQKTGRDANIAASGIAIWHIDQLGNRDNQSLTPNTSHANYECTLVQADNLWHFQSNTNSGDTKDLYYLGNTAAAYTNTFNDRSSPNAHWWSGAGSGLSIYNFSAAGASMTLQFGVPANTLAIRAPNGGEQVYLSSTQYIIWNANISGNVKIDLYKGGVLHTVLSANETNDGSYSWVVSAGLPAATDYTIRISSVNNPAYLDSSDAAFSILAQPTLADALETSGLTWTNSGNANWFYQTSTTHDGADAAQSGAIADNQSSSMETTVTGAGTLTFWWKVSSETNYDYLRFYLDGTEQTGSLAKISGTVDWIQKTVSIPSGNHTVKWGYTKDANTISGSDAAWVDQVVYTPTTAPEIAVEQPLGTNLVDGSATIDCGSISLGSSSPPVTFTVKNTGTANLSGLSLSKDGTHGADYTLGSLGATTLAPAASTTFTVTFSPGATGTRTAAIHIASNDADENPFDISLTGTGVPVGTLAVTPAGGLSSSGNFGGSFSPASQSYTLSNTGSASINWTAAKTATWLDLSATSGTLAAGANTTVTVSYAAAANTLAIGSYSDTVTFSNSTNSNGNTTRAVSLTVNPAAATVILGNLSPTYDGNPKPVSVTTTPSGLSYSLTYAGSPSAPTNAGTYAVVATITDPNYTGSASGSLVIAKATQTLTFAALDPVLDNSAPFALAATTSSGLTVSYASSNSSVATVSGSTVTVVGLGTTTITASQAGDGNYNPATSVPRTLTVVRANPLGVTGGPYKLLVGQSLSLNGSASLPSNGETITAYEWDLNNDNIFSDATGATPSAISLTNLTGIWGMTQGLNPIKLKVTDSANKTSIVSTTVELVLALTWDANGTTAGQTNGAGAWLDTNLWWDGTTNQTWAAGSNATFGGPSTAGGAVTLASPTSVNAITFNTFTGTYTLGTAGQALTLNSGITKNAGADTVSIISPMTLGGVQSWTNHSGTLNVTGGLDLNNNALTIAGAGTTSFNSTSNIIAGSGDITKSGAGVLVLGAAATVPAHTYSGDTNLNGGVTMFSGNTGNLSVNSNINLNGGILESYWTDGLTRVLGTVANQLRITGGESGFSMNGNSGATFNLGTSVTWGSANFNPTKFVLQSAYSQGTSALTFSSAIDLHGADRTILANSGASGTASSTISGALSTSSGTAGLIKEGSGLLILSAANTYNGNTTISEGTLQIGNATAGSLGNGTYNADISIASSSTLKIYSTATQVLGGTISGNGNLAKAYAGTLTLSNTNTYTGSTTITAGKLALGANDVLPNATAVAIGNATLDAATFTDKAGTLDITSTATINLGSGAVLAFDDSSAIDWTGSTLNLTGTFVSGVSLRFGTSNTGLTSTQLAKFSGSGLSSFALNGNGYLTASGGGDDTTPPTLAGSGIVDDMSGGPVDLNTLVTYTVTFSEDMDASTVTAADFGNAGTAAVTIGSVTETSPTSGIFTVQATPTSAGTLQLRVNAAAILKDMAGNSLSTTAAIADDTTLTVGTPYQWWLVANGRAGTEADLNEYAFGTTTTNPIIVASPTEITLGQAPAMQIAGSAVRATYGRRQDYQASGLTYKVKFSANLTTWHDSTDTLNLKYAGSPDLNHPAVVASQGEMDAVSIPFPLFIKTAKGYEKTKSFMMVEVTIP